MKLTLILVAIFSAITSYAQSIEGDWKLMEYRENWSAGIFSRCKDCSNAGYLLSVKKDSLIIRNNGVLSGAVLSSGYREHQEMNLDFNDSTVGLKYFVSVDTLYIIKWVAIVKNSHLDSLNRGLLQEVAVVENDGELFRYGKEAYMKNIVKNFEGFSEKEKKRLAKVGVFSAEVIVNKDAKLEGIRFSENLDTENSSLVTAMLSIPSWPWNAKPRKQMGLINIEMKIGYLKNSNKQSSLTIERLDVKGW